jgi:hypothetical protein
MMKRRALLASAIALPFLGLVSASAQARTASHVRVTFPLLFQVGDGQLYNREGQFSTRIGDKMKMAVDAVLAANPQLKPDLTRPVSFDLRQSDGQPWGRPGPVKLAGTQVFKKNVPWSSPRNAIMAKSLGQGLSGEDSPAIERLSRVVVRAHFVVAPTQAPA